jgi:hypothetical protein
MAERRQHTESRDKDEATADTAGAAMDRFKLLVRRLLHVPREEIQEQRDLREKPTARRARRKLP